MPVNPYQPLIDTFFNIVSWLIPALFTVTALKLLLSAKLKGAAGERTVRKVLDGLGEQVLHDVILPDGRGGLTQVDHLLLTAAGLIIVETKNYSGQIFGQPIDRTWTQRLGKKGFTFQNPLRQNYLHIEAVKALVPGGVPVYGRVVFTDQARFPKGVPEGVSTLRTLRDDLSELSDASRHVCGSLPSAWETVKQAARTDRQARREHLAGLAVRHGRDWRRPLAWVMLAVAAIWIVAVWLIPK